MISNTEKIKTKLGKRYAKERRFKFYGISAILISIAFLLTLLINISLSGLPAFQQTYIKIDLTLDKELLGLDSSYSERQLFLANYSKVIKTSVKTMFPGVNDRKQKRALKQLVSKGAMYQLRDSVMDNPNLIGTTQSFWFLARDDVDVFMKGGIDRALPESDRRLKNFQLVWIDQLLAENRLEKRFNTTFFTQGDSREPEQAGIKGAIIGSLLTMLVTMTLSFPIGVATAVYLEEFAPKNNRWVDVIEININNLAAVPSIVFGLLGLAVFISFFGVPRSVPLVGGLVLALMTLPTIIITSRAAIKAVPPSIREAALGLGASRVQTTFHHVVPAAMPGILTGTIIGMAQALGETAPLLMIGMVAFIADVPQGITDPSTVLPVQIYLWSDSPERAFTERTSAAIMVLLGFLIVMNFLAVIMRKKFEKKW
ncbi:phosphate ABC transporter permease PstA [Candidatus Thioglobus sp.]|uniref:phosphate ABC transporter permease PstA n=1 Tax=Candidatus Thioglobus sp. TaxID=2026721 RepID=UPI003D09923F